ncbi:hypothetical protein WN48_08293 [Eufriesea mexicana]|uniref:Uncharacterized protein n=1 Tax=Eufriesea mexicana TaxID=516756 RepID=A0A310SAW8_9HYME|nr:hypothetical protein WN48_08293 [Eufriesea mexicana]
MSWQLWSEKPFASFRLAVPWILLRRSFDSVAWCDSGFRSILASRELQRSPTAKPMQFRLFIPKSVSASSALSETGGALCFVTCRGERFSRRQAFGEPDRDSRLRRVMLGSDKTRLDCGLAVMKAPIFTNNTVVTLYRALLYQRTAEAVINEGHDKRQYLIDLVTRDRDIIKQSLLKAPNSIPNIVHPNEKTLSNHLKQKKLPANSVQHRQTFHKYLKQLGKPSLSRPTRSNEEAWKIARVPWLHPAVNSGCKFDGKSKVGRLQRQPGPEHVTMLSFPVNYTEVSQICSLVMNLMVLEKLEIDMEDLIGQYLYSNSLIFYLLYGDTALSPKSPKENKKKQSENVDKQRNARGHGGPSKVAMTVPTWSRGARACDGSDCTEIHFLAGHVGSVARLAVGKSLEAGFEGEEVARRIVKDGAASKPFKPAGGEDIRLAFHRHKSSPDVEATWCGCYVGHFVAALSEGLLACTIPLRDSWRFLINNRVDYLGIRGDYELAAGIVVDGFSDSSGVDDRDRGRAETEAKPFDGGGYKFTLEAWVTVGPNGRLKRYHLGSVDLVVVPEITRDAEGGDPVGGSRAGFLLHDANPALAPQS